MSELYNRGRRMMNEEFIRSHRFALVIDIDKTGGKIPSGVVAMIGTYEQVKAAKRRRVVIVPDDIGDLKVGDRVRLNYEITVVEEM